MIGNDIVDLKQAARDSTWQRPRFLDKVFTKQEQDFINSSQQQHQTVWLLWSMKEAAYKIYVQHFGTRFFNPKKINCTLISETTGIVSIDSIEYRTESIITEDYIYTNAVSKDINTIKSTCFEIEATNYKTQSKMLKSRFLKDFSETCEASLNSLSVTKSDIGIPQLFKDDVQIDLSLSFTHHGMFSGYGYCIR